MADKKPADSEHQEAATDAPKPKSKKKLIIIVVVLLLVGGGAAFFLTKKPPAEDTPKEEVQVERVLKRVKLDPFIVNLSEQKSFLKVTMLVEFDEALLEHLTAQEGGKGAEGKGEGHGGGGSGGENPAEGGLPEAMAEREPIIRDKIIAILSAKTTAEVLSSNGKEALKEELIDAINEVLDLPEPVVVGVYFTEFMIQ